MLTSETTQAAILFLISIGSLAANELRERWSLRRKKAGKPFDLSTHDEEEATRVVQELLSQKKDLEVKQVLDLAQRKRKLIYDAQRAKLNDEIEFNEGRIDLTMLELRRERHDQQIRDKLTEIVSDLRAIGVEIEQENI